jgi:hypothetical protein
MSEYTVRTIEEFRKVTRDLNISNLYNIVNFNTSLIDFFDDRDFYFIINGAKLSEEEDSINPKPDIYKINLQNLINALKSNKFPTYGLYSMAEGYKIKNYPIEIYRLIVRHRNSNEEIYKLLLKKDIDEISEVILNRFDYNDKELLNDIIHKRKISQNISELNKYKFIPSWVFNKFAESDNVNDRLIAVNNNFTDKNCLEKLAFDPNEEVSSIAKSRLKSISNNKGCIVLIFPFLSIILKLYKN